MALKRKHPELSALFTEVPVEVWLTHVAPFLSLAEVEALLRIDPRYARTPKPLHVVTHEQLLDLHVRGTPSRAFVHMSGSHWLHAWCMIHLHTMPKYVNRSYPIARRNMTPVEHLSAMARCTTATVYGGSGEDLLERALPGPVLPSLKHLGVEFLHEGRTLSSLLVRAPLLHSLHLLQTDDASLVAEQVPCLRSLKIVDCGVHLDVAVDRVEVAGFRSSNVSTTTERARINRLVLIGGCGDGVGPLVAAADVLELHVYNSRHLPTEAINAFRGDTLVLSHTNGGYGKLSMDDSISTLRRYRCSFPSVRFLRVPSNTAAFYVLQDVFPTPLIIVAEPEEPARE